ncbi:MAG: hypothetical protein LBN71_11695 [Tannerella sp.]|nr:hypothetical protein [Tannerella sp.]
MKVKVIKTERDYREALRRSELISDARKGSAEGDELEVLGLLIDHYEKKHILLEMPDPIAAIKFRMEQLGYNQQNLANMAGLHHHASEILNKRKKLSLRVIRQLHEKLDIPAEVLIQDYMTVGAPDAE